MANPTHLGLFSWHLRLPIVYRYLEQEYVAKFFETSEIRLSSFSQFRKHKDEQRGDSAEGKAISTITGPEFTLGTCKMGLAADPAAVVDTDLRVIGTRSLRIVDASVMPDLVGVNINAAVMMIAEKAADLIRGRGAMALAPETAH